MQDLTNVNSNGAPPAEAAVDVGPYLHLVLEVQVPKAATAGTLAIQEANTRAEDAFSDISGATTVPLNATGPTRVKLENPARYVRWSVSGLTGDATILINGLGR